MSFNSAAVVEDLYKVLLQCNTTEDIKQMSMKDIRLFVYGEGGEVMGHGILTDSSTDAFKDVVGALKAKIKVL